MKRIHKSMRASVRAALRVLFTGRLFDAEGMWHEPCDPSGGPVPPGQTGVVGRGSGAVCYLRDASTWLALQGVRVIARTATRGDITARPERASAARPLVFRRHPYSGVNRGVS
jgi:hypothetical protein